MNNQCLIFDPIDFRGGSKVAIESIFTECSTLDSKVLVLSNDKNSWLDTSFKRLPFWHPKLFAHSMHGVAFLMKHLFYAMTVILTLLKYREIKLLVATSGPGIDLGLYLAGAVIKLFRPLKLVQLVQGPVAESKLSARCLAAADYVFYLENTHSDLIRLQKIYSGCGVDQLGKKYQLLKNGLNESQWPSKTQCCDNRIFWAASNLKWKGLDLLVQMLMNLNQTIIKVGGDICFIPANNQGMPVSDTNIEIPGVRWHEMPDDLDAIRKQSNLFISTSTQEPFGLSILEALAAGLCVIIPSDGAYWDTRLEHDVNCIKYTPDNLLSLTAMVTEMLKSPERIKRIGDNGQLIAHNYKANIRYKNIHKTIMKELDYAA